MSRGGIAAEIGYHFRYMDADTDGDVMAIRNERCVERVKIYPYPYPTSMMDYPKPSSPLPLPPLRSVRAYARPREAWPPMPAKVSCDK
jgi:hypothetical protein